MEEVITRSAVLAAEINTIKNQTLRTVLSASVEIGKRLSEAKGLIVYGEWEHWLSSNVDYSQSTANNLMRIYKEYGDNQMSLFSAPKAELFGSLSYSQAIALFALPAEDREEFVESHDMESISIRELNTEIDRLKKEKSGIETDLSKERAANDKLEKQRQDAVGEREKLRDQINKEKENSVKQSETLKKDLADMRKALEEAINRQPEQTSLEPKISDEELAKLRAEITEQIASEKESQLKELEKQIEDDTDEIEQMSKNKSAEISQREERIAKLEVEKAALEKKISSSSDGTLQQFAALFEAFQEDFARMERKLTKISATDKTMADKISGALGKILGGMTQKIEMRGNI